MPIYRDHISRCGLLVPWKVLNDTWWIACVLCWSIVSHWICLLGCCVNGLHMHCVLCCLTSDTKWIPEIAWYSTRTHTHYLEVFGVIKKAQTVMSWCNISHKTLAMSQFQRLSLQITNTILSSSSQSMFCSIPAQPMVLYPDDKICAAGDKWEHQCGLCREPHGLD